LVVRPFLAELLISKSIEYNSVKCVTGVIFEIFAIAGDLAELAEVGLALSLLLCLELQIMSKSMAFILGKGIPSLEF